MRRKIKKRQGVRGEGRWSRTETTLTQLYLMQIASDFSFFLFPVLSLTLSLCLLSSRVLCGRQSIRKKSFGKTNSGSNRQKKERKEKRKTLQGKNLVKMQQQNSATRLISYAACPANLAPLLLLLLLLCFPLLLILHFAQCKNKYAKKLLKQYRVYIEYIYLK